MAQTPKVAVSISATDDYTAEMLKFRKQVLGISSDLKKMDLPGTPKLDAGMGGIVGQMRQQITAARGQVGGGALSLARAIPGLGGLGALGTAGGIGAAVMSYASFGTSLENTSKQANMTAAGLNSMRGAARMAGLDAGAADTAMVGLNATVRDAVYGRNGTAATYFRRFGVDIGSLATGAKSAEEVLPKVADTLRSMYAVDPNAATRLGGIFGLTPEGVALLARGGDELDRLRQKASALSPWTRENAESAKKYAENIGALTTAAEGWRNVLVNGATPALVSMFGYLERETPAAQKRMADFGKEIGGVFDDIKRLGHELGADQVPGWLKRQFDGSNPITTPMGPGGVFNQPGISTRAGSIPSRGPLGNPGPGGGGFSANAADVNMPADKFQRAKAIHDEFVRQGADDVRAWGYAANAIHENGGMMGGKPGDGGRSTGMFQWNGDRRAAFIRRYGHDPSQATMQESVEFKLWEARDGGERNNQTRINAARSPGAAAAAISEDDIRPFDRMGERIARGRTAEALAARAAQEAAARATPAVSRPEPTPEAPDLTRGRRVPATPDAPAEQPDLTRGGRVPVGAAPSVGGTATLRIVHENAPQGTSAHLDASELEGVFASIHTQPAMPAGVFSPQARPNRGY